MAERRILVTGSSRGIGAEIARRLAGDGWTVGIHYTESGEEAQRLADELGGTVHRADLAEPGAAIALWQDFVGTGRADGLVNNAGVYHPLQWIESNQEAFETNYAHTFAINLDAPLRLMRAASQHFAAQGQGKILNVASRVGFRGEAGAALYSASKAALINLTRALAVELAPRNVQLFGIAPGWVETAMSREGMQDRLPQILRDIPLGRMANPADCAAAVSFLLSDEAAYLSGVTIDINGASYFH